MLNRDKNANRGDNKIIYFKDAMLHLWLFEDIYVALKTITAICFCHTTLIWLICWANKAGLFLTIPDQLCSFARYGLINMSRKHPYISEYQIFHNCFLYIINIGNCHNCLLPFQVFKTFVDAFLYWKPIESTSLKPYLSLGTICYLVHKRKK